MRDRTNTLSLFDSQANDIRDRRTNTLSLFNDDDVEKEESAGMFAKNPQRQKADKTSNSDKEEKVWRLVVTIQMIIVDGGKKIWIITQSPNQMV